MARDGQLARDLRTGLDSRSVVRPSMGIKSKEIPFLDQRWFGKTRRVHISEFSCVLAICLLAIAGWMLWIGSTVATPLSLLLTASIIVVIGYRAPTLLRPVWESWMKLAHYLGAVVTFIILSFTWFFVTIPVALLLKIIGKKVMDTSYGAAVESYWEDRNESENDFKLLSRQY